MSLHLRVYTVACAIFTSKYAPLSFYWSNKGGDRSERGRRGGGQPVEPRRDVGLQLLAPVPAITHASKAATCLQGVICSGGGGNAPGTLNMHPPAVPRFFALAFRAVLLFSLLEKYFGYWFWLGRCIIGEYPANRIQFVGLIGNVFHIFTLALVRNPKTSSPLTLARKSIHTFGEWNSQNTKCFFVAVNPWFFHPKILFDVAFLPKCNVRQGFFVKEETNIRKIV